MLSASTSVRAAAPSATLDCDREMRKTIEAIQAWRRTHSGQYPAWISDLKAAGLVARDSAICPDVLREAAKADPSHPLGTSRMEGGDPAGTYEYEMSKFPKSQGERLWLPPGAPDYTRQDVKAELLRRSFYEQVPILRCSSHRGIAPTNDISGACPWRNCTATGDVYWSPDYWEQRWLSDVPYCCRDANVLFGLKGPPFHTDRAPTLATALDLRPWSCAFGDHPWWWTFPMFDESPNSQKAATLRPFFQEKHGRTTSVAGLVWWIDGLVQLQGRISTDPMNQYKEPGAPAFVWERTGLAVNRRFRRASWLQGTVWATTQGETAGWLQWHYADGAVERVPLIYGRTTARFWGDAEQVDGERGFPASVWTSHQSAKEVGKERWLRLYQQSWDNPRPDVPVTTVDFISNRNSPAAPFLIAVNVH
jgi:hypothetical protein